MLYRGVVMDIGTNYFIPIARLFYDWLTIPVTFFGNTIPLYIFFIFGLLIGLFIKVLTIIGGIHV